VDDKQSTELEIQMKSAKDELKKLQKKVLGLNLNNFAMNKSYTGKEDFDEKLGVSGYLYLHQEVQRKRDTDHQPGESALRRLQDAFKIDNNVLKMQTLKDIEELIYVLINNPTADMNKSINASVDSKASYQSLTEKIRELIRHDRGFSIVNSTDSGGIPSPIQETDSFKKLIEFKETDGTSEFNSRKVKKIEFSDTMSKENANKGKGKKAEKEKGEINFTHSSIDRMIFDEMDEIDSKIDADLHDLADGSIAETVKRRSSNNITEVENNSNKQSFVVEQSFENPEELSQEFKRYSLNSSIDDRFVYQQDNRNYDKLRELEVPSINNSLIDYNQPRTQSNRHINENTDIQHQDSLSHKDSFRAKKLNDEINEKKATKKEFENKNKKQPKQDIDQDEIDRNSTTKKLELNKITEEQAKPEVDQQIYRNLNKELNPKGKYICFDHLEGNRAANRINFDGRKSGEERTVNCSVLSRSKSGDAKIHTSSRNDKESINTGAGENLYYGKSKEANGSKQVMIEEIEIPLEEQNEEKMNENKKTEKNLHSAVKKKVIKEEQPNKGDHQGIHDYKPKYNYEKEQNKKNSVDKKKGSNQNLKSERHLHNQPLNDDSIERRRKQSDLIIKKGKALNVAAGSNSKSVSPNKRGYYQTNEDPQSSCNVSFSKNKRDLFQDKISRTYSTKSKLKKTNKNDVNSQNDEYSNFLKQKELGTSGQEGLNPAVSFKKKITNDKLREGSNKRHKTPTHIDCGDHSQMKVVFAQDPKLRNQERNNSRNDFTVYTSNTADPNLQRDDFARDMMNQMKVKDYIQMNKIEHPLVGANSATNKKTLDKLSSDDGKYNLNNEVSDFNFYTPNNQQNLNKNSSTNQMYLVNKHPLSGSAGYSRELENDPSL